jgi:hypothetical protein
MYKREDKEAPLAISKWGWKYHHLGVPVNDPVPGEYYIPHLKIYVSGFESSPFGVQWMRFEDDCPIDNLTKSIPHVAFEVENIEEALACSKFELLSEINSPSEGTRVVMIKHEGAPIELIEFKK